VVAEIMRADDKTIEAFISACCGAGAALYALLEKASLQGSAWFFLGRFIDRLLPTIA
jgi:hypothetical protein